MSERIPTLIVGGTGYVAGELLRLVAGHPQLELHGVSSETAAGTAVSAAFPHLARLLKAEGFITQADLAARMTAPRMALFAAAPHAVSAGVIATLLQAAETRHCKLTVVDVSSDFRFRNAIDFQAVYKTPHGAPELLPLFTCAMPEHLSGIPGPHIGHPGCFATSMLAGAIPLLKLDLCEPQIYATLDMGPVPIPSIEELTTSARTRLDAFVRTSITSLGMTAKSAVLVGRPSDEIISYAGSHDAKMVIMTTHGYSGVKHLLLGSTTEAVLRHAACPVLSIRTA